MPPLPTLCIAVCSALVATAAAVVGASDISTPAGNWSLVKLQSAATGPEHAVCLDGSPYAFYMRPSITNASDNSKWVVFMEGGGWCGSDANCAQRALTPLGSSTSYGPDPGPTEADALFDDFGDAVAVYAKYCDGGSWTGNVTEPITVGKQQIWYRGRPLLDALLDELLQQGLSTADELLFAGCSAGALTTYVHADYVRTRISPTTRMAALADAMFSLHHNAYPANPENYYTRQFQWGYTAWNSTGSLNDACEEHYGPENAWMCFHGAVAAQFITTVPLFILNSRFDTWQQNGVLGLPSVCHAQVVNGTVELCAGASSNSTLEEIQKFWLAYGDSMTQALDAVSPWHGAHLTNCPTHCQSGSLTNPATPGHFANAAIMDWYAQAITTGQNSSWVAPRQVGDDSLNCVPQAPAS